MPTISVNGLDAFYEDDDFTDGWRTDVETVFIQHGIGRNTTFWNHWIPPLAGRYRVIRRDLRGFGRSGDPGPDYVWAMDDLMEDLRAFLEAKALGPVHFLGESIGGPLGVAFAAKWPERFKSLTLCSSPTTLTNRQQLLSLGQKSRADVVRALGKDGMVRALIAQGVISGGSPQRLEWVAREWCKTPAHVLETISGLSTVFDVGPLLPLVKVPTLVLAPGNSPITALADQVAPGSARATISQPSVPPAPGLLSTTICCPSTSPSRGASMRPTMSVGPPGAKAMTMRIGRSG